MPSSLPNNAALTSLFSELAKKTKEEQAGAMRLLFQSKRETDKDITRKRAARSEAARIIIPDCKDPKRREKCLADPERFLRTYLADRYRLDFGRDHRFMIESVVSAAQRGGKQAIAAPRGRGKSEIVKGLMLYLPLALLSRFLLPIAATTDLAEALFGDFKRKIQTNILLAEDFPEVCWPVRELDGAPQRAGKQHVDGVPTRIVWTGDMISLPHVPGSPYGGIKMSYYGLDSAFRGVNVDGDRPDFVLIDDPETAESARSDTQIEDRENILDRDVAGLEGQDKPMAIVVLTTVQNHKCLSAKLTDATRKPAYNGRRFGMIVKWPEHLDLWDEYIAMRRADQTAGDEFANNATQFYLANAEKMNAGVEMISDHFKEIEDNEGNPTVFSAIQQAYNKICDTSLEAYQTEYQNDPVPEEKPETTGLTPGKIASRISGLLQGERHQDTEITTVGIDIGKYYSHWVKVGWRGNAIGNIIDYGIMETPGVTVDCAEKAVEQALLKALTAWRTDITATNTPDFCLVDSGDYSAAIYEFVRRAGGFPFAAAKGWDTRRFKQKPDGKGIRAFVECYASHQPAEGLWLYNAHTEYWKEWLHERFNTEPFDENQIANDGSLTLFAAPTDRKRHLAYSHHIMAEETVYQFTPGKGMKRTRVERSRNNHYLDATALACCAAACMGIKVVPRQPVVQTATQIRARAKPKFTNQYGQPFLATER
jgi:hypothetical protein